MRWTAGVGRRWRMPAAAFVGLFFALGFSAEVSAQTATWTGTAGDGEWTTSGNWSPSVVPTDMAIFSGASPTSILIDSGWPIGIGTLLFTPGAPAYSFTICGCAPTEVDITGAGIVNQSSAIPVFHNEGFLYFENSSSAGNAVVVDNSFAYGWGYTFFENSSTAANAKFINFGLLEFDDESTAGHAVINNEAGGYAVYFTGDSTAGSATITNHYGSGILFFDNSTAGNATIINHYGGVVDFSASSGPAGDGNLSVGSIEGAGDFLLGADELTVGSNNLSTTVSGDISDCDGGCDDPSFGGSLVKVGTGTLTLSGINDYTGTTFVDGGTLAITGDISSSSGVTVASGGTLAGTGVVPMTDVLAGGTLAPGYFGIGTLNVNDSLTFENGSFYQIAVSPSSASSTSVSGTATINGGIVHVTPQYGLYSPSYTYTILTSGGVTGTFTGAISDFALLDPSLSYDLDNVYLTLKIASDFCSVAANANQCNTGRAIQAAGPNNPLYDLAINLTLPQVQQAFQILSGEIQADTSGQILSDSLYLRELLLLRLFDADNGGQGSFGAGPGGAIAYYQPAQDEPQQVLAYAPRDFYDEAGPIKLKVPHNAPNDVGLTFWSQAVGAWGQTETNGNASTLSRTLAGFYTGADRMFGPVRAGIAAGYLNSGLMADASTANINSAHFSTYAGTSFGSVHLRGGADYGWNAIATTRAVNLPGLSETENGSTHANEGQLFGEVSDSFAFNALALEPFGGLAFAHLATDGFAETGGAAALAVAGSTNDLGYSTLGTRLRSHFVLPNGMTLTPWGSAGWEHAIGTVAPAATVSFLSSGVPFSVQGAPLARDSALIQMGANLGILPLTTVGLAYSGELAPTSNDQSIRGDFIWRF